MKEKTIYPYWANKVTFLARLCLCATTYLVQYEPTNVTYLDENVALAFGGVNTFWIKEIALSGERYAKSYIVYYARKVTQG